MEQRLIVIGYGTSKLITSDTDLEMGNAQRERWMIATMCWSPRVYVIQRTELSIKVIPDVKVGERRLSAGQEDIQEVEVPDTVDNIQKTGDEVQKEDGNWLFLEGEQGAQLIVTDDETNDRDDNGIDVEEDCFSENFWEKSVSLTYRITL